MGNFMEHFKLVLTYLRAFENKFYAGEKRTKTFPFLGEKDNRTIFEFEISHTLRIYSSNVSHLVR